jgi:hypothetical protein
MKFIPLFLALLLPLAGRAQDADLPYPPQTREMSVALFNEKNLDGWTFCMKDNADPLKTWVATNGVIHCTGLANGYLRTTQVYSNYFLTVEWRFLKIAPKKDNTGVLVHMQLPDKVWPACYQIQGKHDHQGDLIVMAGAECKERKAKDPNATVPLRGDSVERPAGEWNKAEIICLRGKVSCFINNKFVNEITECSINSGYIGFQSEGADFEIRTVAYCPLKY